jgi:hypothetical protein
LPKGDNPFAIGAAPELTGDHRTLGTDWRFFTIAQHLGFKLWGDADVEARHGVVFWLDHALADKLRDEKKENERQEKFVNIFREERGMDKVTLEMRIKQLQAQKADLENQRASAQQTADFLGRQLIAVNAVISDEMWLLEQWKLETFPTVPESEREAELANRTTIPNVTEPVAKDARMGVLSKEAAGFVEDLNAIRSIPARA